MQLLVKPDAGIALHDALDPTVGIRASSGGRSNPGAELAPPATPSHEEIASHAPPTPDRLSTIPEEDEDDLFTSALWQRIESEPYSDELDHEEIRANSNYYKYEQPTVQPGLHYFTAGAAPMTSTSTTRQTQRDRSLRCTSQVTQPSS